MNFLVLLPIIPALWWIARRSLSDALVDVYLPALILVPNYYLLRIPTLWGINAQDAALFPIALGTLIKYGRHWRLQRSDLWLLLFLIGDGIGSGKLVFTQGLRAFCVLLFSSFLPYVVGKLLLEQEGLRQRFVRRLVWLVSLVAVVSVVEWRLARNLFKMFYGSVLSTNWPDLLQMRGGFARVQGPFGHPIIAGTVFTSVWLFALWLRDSEKWTLGAAERRVFGIRISTILVWTLFAGIIMAGSRGPWIGAAVGFGISRIGRAKNVKRAVVAVALLGSIVGGVGIAYLNSYISVDLSSVKDQDQENAVYRRLLLAAYEPVVQAGGLFGWGENFPRVSEQTSVDNEYLWLRLTQGPFGLALFILLSTEASIALLRSARQSGEKQDFYFAFILLAVLAGILVTGATVEIYDQSYYLLFLCLGWSLSLRKAQTSPAIEAAPFRGQYRFRGELTPGPVHVGIRFGRGKENGQ